MPAHQVIRPCVVCDDGTVTYPDAPRPICWECKQAERLGLLNARQRRALAREALIGGPAQRRHNLNDTTNEED